MMRTVKLLACPIHLGFGIVDMELPPPYLPRHGEYAVPCITVRQDTTWHNTTWHDTTHTVDWQRPPLPRLSWHGECNALHCNAWHNTTWHDTTWHGMMWHDMIGSKISTRLQLLLTAILKGLYLLIFLHLSALMNRLALSDLLMKSCSKIPKRNLRSFGQRFFSFMAPSLWNSQFKSQLKTFLFAQAFL